MEAVQREEKEYSNNLRYSVRFLILWCNREKLDPKSGDDHHVAQLWRPDAKCHG